MSTKEIKQNARRFYEEALGQGKTELIDELLDPNFVCHDPNSESGDIRGADAVKGEIGYFHQAIPDLSWRVHDQVAEGNEVTTRYTMAGTHQGEFFGVPGTGQRVEVTGINVDRFDDGGKLVEEWASYDMLGALRQIGAIPEPQQQA